MTVDQLAQPCEPACTACGGRATSWVLRHGPKDRAMRSVLFSLAFSVDEEVPILDFDELAAWSLMDGRTFDRTLRRLQSEGWVALDVDGPGRIAVPGFEALTQARHQPGSPRPPRRGCYLYRLWGPDGRLVYVGVSRCLADRLKAHRRRWDETVWTKATWESQPDVASMFAAERRAIEDEMPPLNVAGVR